MYYLLTFHESPNPTTKPLRGVAPETKLYPRLTDKQS